MYKVSLSLGIRQSCAKKIQKKCYLNLIESNWWDNTNLAKNKIIMNDFFKWNQISPHILVADVLMSKSRQTFEKVQKRKEILKHFIKEAIVTRKQYIVLSFQLKLLKYFSMRKEHKQEKNICKFLMLPTINTMISFWSSKNNLQISLASIKQLNHHDFELYISQIIPAW